MPDLRSSVLGAAYTALARPVLFRAGGGDAESAHHLTVAAAAAASGHRPGRALLRATTSRVEDPVRLLGLTFPNRVGLAAGMDKDARAVRAWGALGLGHVEVGTVTALPQPGNPRPRLVRLPRSRAVVNRMGFNNPGVHAVAGRLRRARREGSLAVPVGVSIGKSRVTPVEEAVGDYLTSVTALHGLADYLAVNVSSPNTPGLRGLQDAGPLAELLAAVVHRTRELADGGPHPPVPVLVKLAPDLSDSALAEALEVAVEAGVAGFVATNTTLSRDGVHPAERALADQPGGLSGAPLAPRAREVVARIRAATELPLIGVGGVMGPQDARALRAAGADLVQLYTGLVYAGPALVAEAARAAAPPVA